MSAAEDRLHALAGTLRIDDTTAVLEVLRLLDEERAEATRLRAANVNHCKRFAEMTETIRALTADRDSWRNTCENRTRSHARAAPLPAGASRVSRVFRLILPSDVNNAAALIVDRRNDGHLELKLTIAGEKCWFIFDLNPVDYQELIAFLQEQAG